MSKFEVMKTEPVDAFPVAELPGHTVIQRNGELFIEFPYRDERYGLKLKRITHVVLEDGW